MKERIVRAVAGLIVLTSVALAHFINPSWIWLSVFAGVNLFQSAITQFCPLEKFLDFCGVKDKEFKQNRKFS